MRYKATGIIFLSFSIVVALVNIIFGNYQYTLFIVPFLFGIIESGKKSRIYELIGIYIISFYVLIFEDINIGIMFLIISSCFLFTFRHNYRLSRIIAYATTAIIGIVSYVTTKDSTNIFIHSILDMAFYFVCTGAVYFAIYRCVEENKAPDKPLDKEYLELLDKLSSLAHESIDMLKNARGGK